MGLLSRKKAGFDGSPTSEESPSSSLSDKERQRPIEGDISWGPSDNGPAVHPPVVVDDSARKRSRGVVWSSPVTHTRRNAQLVLAFCQVAILAAFALWALPGWRLIMQMPAEAKAITAVSVAALMGWMRGLIFLLYLESLAQAIICCWILRREKLAVVFTILIPFLCGLVVYWRYAPAFPSPHFLGPAKAPNPAVIGLGKLDPLMVVIFAALPAVVANLWRVRIGRQYRKTTNL